MSQWILLSSEAELEEKAKTLRRKCRGHYYTNYYFIHSSRENDLQYTEMFYQEDGDNLYAIERMDDFYQLFYFVGDTEHFRLELPPSVECGVLTCEFDEMEEKEKQGPVLERLYAEGFSVYKKYHYYDRKPGDFRRFHRKGFDTTYQASVEELSVMYDIFDPYSDNLPLRKAFPEYLESMNIVSCAVNGKYAGSSMWKKSGFGGQFIFICDEFRGKGIGGYLLSAGSEKFYSGHPNKVFHVAIEDQNIGSIQMHETFGFERIKQYHTVLMRRP